MKSKLDKEMLDASRMNSDNWKWIFYYNPNDPRIFVRKLNRKMGWTINCGNINSYIAFAGIILIITIFKYLL
ncbi:MAG: hypothetical protein H8E34_04275 [Bacteroidetes bacterium]|nr:hypothetical protein [Bacteroidota bacterium]MBL6943252.1 hypothetical protein [Bacteroidales bacterium]